MEAFAEYQRVWGGQQATTSGCRVSGRVLDARRGKPLAHALVMASAPRAWTTPRLDPNEAQPLTITDDDGRWALALPERGPHELAVSAVGYFPEFQQLADCPTKAASFWLRAGGAVVFGSVRAIDGAPLAGVAISARSVVAAAPLGRVVAAGLSDHQGRYALACAAGDYVIEARYPRAVTARARVALSSVGFANFRMVLAAAISGHVRSRSTGMPTPNAIVSGAADPAIALPGAATQSTVSDATGAFTLAGLWPGAVTLTAHADGLTSHELTTVTVGTNEERKGVELLLDRGYTISGSVRLAGAAPARDTWLTAVDDESERVWPAAGPSDESGRFSISGLPPGKYSLQPGPRDSRAVATPPLEIVDRDISAEVVILARDVPPSARAQPALAEGQGVAIRGRVVDRHLRPTPDVWLELSSSPPVKGLSAKSASRPFDSIVHRVQLSDRGEFEVGGLSPGYYRLALYDDYGRRSWANSPALDDSSAPLLLLVRPTQNPTFQLETEVCAGTIYGRALNPSGAGVANAWVYARREGDDESTRAGADSAQAGAPTVVTSATGSFELHDLCPGSYRVSVTSSDREASAWRGGVQPNARLTFTLVGVSTITGAVSYDRAPVTDYLLTVSGSRTRRSTVRAPDGKYRLGGLDSGMYEVLLSSQQGYAQSMLEVAAGSVVERNFELESWSSLSARIVDGGGQPLIGVDVQAVFEPPGGEVGDLLGPSVRIRRAVTDARGQFEIERVPAGRGYLALSRAGRELLIAGVPYTSQFGVLLGPSPRLDLEVKRATAQDLGVIHARVP